MNLYSRLFKNRERPSKSPLENFLTEAMADLFNRLPFESQIDFLGRLLPAAVIPLRAKSAKHLEAGTQISIIQARKAAIPDIVIYLNGKPFILFEVKVGAPVHQHALPSQSGKLLHGAAIIQSQLKTYSDWIYTHRSADWRGAVIFLTHRTRAPEDFETVSDTAPICISRNWRDVGEWLAGTHSPEENTVHHALATELHMFLGSNGLMTSFLTSRDIASLELFWPSYRPLRHTFKTVMTELRRCYPKSPGGNTHLEISPDSNGYCGWYYINPKMNPAGSRFWLSVGICFPDEGAKLWYNVQKNLPKHAPFYFVFFADDEQEMTVADFLKELPDGWLSVNDDYDAVAIKLIGDLEGDPDSRAAALVAWAQEKVGQLVARIPNYEAAPIEKTPDAEAEEA